VDVEAFVQQQNRSSSLGKRFDYVALAPAAAALCYPFFLRAFHAIVGSQAATPSPLAIVGGILVLAVAFVVPFLGLALACRPTATVGARRLAYASVAAPTLYVLFGVVQALVHSPISDEIVWCVIWLAIAIWSQSARDLVAAPVPAVGRWHCPLSANLTVPRDCNDRFRRRAADTVGAAGGSSCSILLKNPPDATLRPANCPFSSSRCHTNSLKSLSRVSIKGPQTVLRQPIGVFSTESLQSRNRAGHGVPRYS
jgi:hypothetical protein